MTTTTTATRPAAPAADSTLGEISIPSRFNGPRASANGGYAAGAVASFLPGPAEVTLRLPPALDRPLAVVAGDAGAVRVLDGADLVAEGRSVEELEIRPPVRPSFAYALGARERHFGNGVRHPLSDCFVCGPERGTADGLGVSPGPHADLEDVGVAPFAPDDTVAVGGVVRPEVVWAVLDCPSYVPSMWRAERISLLGRLAAQRERDVTVGERLVVVGWPLGHDGRKRFTASALIDEEGEVVARAKATWIEIDATMNGGQG